MTTHTHEGSEEPAQWLSENIKLLPKGKVFDVAMGSGRNAIYLAKMGFSVEGVDISTEAIESVLETAQRTGVTLKAEVADLDGEYRIKQGYYDVITCFNYLERSLIPQIKEGVREGGVIAYETFIVEQARFGKPRNPDYLLKHNELLEMFREFRCLRYREGVFEGPVAIASIIAQKV